jgi:broad specificity phosphatase PhoE
MTQSLYCVRHGEVANPGHVVYARLPGFSLSDVGRRQAEAAARWFERADLDVVVSSPLERAVETAAVVAGRSGAELQIDEALVEWRLGDRWAGTVWEDLPSRHPGELEAYLDHPDHLDFTPETLSAVAERMSAAAGRWAAHGVVALVSHQDTIQAARLELTGRPLADLHQVKPSHGAVVHLERSKDRWHEVGLWSPEQAPAASADE